VDDLSRGKRKPYRNYLNPLSRDAIRKSQETLRRTDQLLDDLRRVY
jgi:hypothetical protein